MREEGDLVRLLRVRGGRGNGMGLIRGKALRVFWQGC